VGFGATATATGATAIGDGAEASAAGATSLGRSANASAANSTAIGAGASATRANQVAVGTSSSTYTMAGLNSAASLSAQSGSTRFVTTDSAGNLATSGFGPGSVAELGGQLNALSGRVDQLSTRVDVLTNYAVQTRREARGGIAIGIASAQVRYDDRPGKLSLGAGVGTFKGEAGVAAGLGYTAPNQLWRANLAASSSGRGDWGVGAGFSLTLN
jgi:autotransporter adhesin